MVAGRAGREDNSWPVKFWRFLLSAAGVVLTSVGTLLFQPTVFCGITIPVVAKLAGWKARAVSAKLSAFGSLEITGLEAVNENKSRIGMDTAKVEFDPLQVLTGRPEILRADFRFAMVDLEIPPTQPGKKASPISIPFSLREATIDLVEGRLRTETGAWILKSAHASAEGWDGQTPREIRLQLGHLDWNGPGKQELATTTQATAQKSKDPAGGDVWELKLKTDVSTVVDLPPWNLVSPCQLVFEGKAMQGRKGDWRVDGLQAVWQGVGGVRLAAKVGGMYAADGDWKIKIDLEPTDLRLAGIFLQPRGIENVFGTVAGSVKLQGGPKQSLGVGVDLNGQAFQLVAAGGATWPAQPAAIGLASRAEWREAEGVLRVESLSALLGRVGQPADLQISLDRPAVFQLSGSPQAAAVKPASLQWTLRGLELAALAPIVFDPEKFHVEGGKLSASGSAQIEGERVGLAGRVESRLMTASGNWVQGRLVIQSGSLDFQGFLEKGTQLHMESATVRAAWEGGAPEDLLFTGKGEWELAKRQGFLAGDLNVGLAGLGKAWAGAKFWPEDGQAKAHVEFSGNPVQRGDGLFSASFRGMRWPGEKTAAWGADCSSEIRVEKETWTMPELVLRADRAGQSLVEGKISAGWRAAPNQGRVRVELARAESAFVVPLLKNFTPDWQWTEASGKGSFEFVRQDQQDRVEAELEAAVTVDTGTTARPRPVDFSSVQGNVKASWPSGSSGVLSIDSLTMVAKHRNGTEALRASLDAPLALEMKGPEDWQPAGTLTSSGMVQFGGWPIGILAPLVLPEARESSIAGTLSGFLKVQSDPRQRTLKAQLDVSCPDFSVELPRLQLSENQTSLQADLALVADGTLAIEKVNLASRQKGLDWLELSATKTSRQGLAVVGKADLATLGRNLPAISPYVQDGTLLLKANVGEPKDGVRKIGFSSQAQSLTVGLPEIGTIPSLQAEIIGWADWGKDGLASLDDLDATVKGPGGELLIRKLDAKPGGAVAWESANIPEGWVRILAKPWLQPNRWVNGDLELKEGFWEPNEHGASGEINALLVRASLSDQPSSIPLSLRLDGTWDYDHRTDSFSLKNSSLRFFEFPTQPEGEVRIFLPPVQIPLFQAGPDRLEFQLAGGVLDLRGVLDQVRAWQSPPQPAGSPTPVRSLFFDVALDQLILPQVRLGPVKIDKFQFHPEGIRCESLALQMLGRPGTLSGSMQASPADSRQNQLVIRAENFPLAALAGLVDHSGELAGDVNGRLETGTGSLWIQINASLENINSFRTSLLEEAGRALGSSTLIPSSKLNSLALACTLQKSQVTISKFQITGSALELGLAGSIDLSSRQLNLKGPLGLTREAIQSCGVLQGMVLDDKLASPSDYYVKMPGDLEVTGPWDNPRVDFDKLKALWRGALNLGIGFLQGTGNAADSATGAALGAPGSILQRVGNLLKGF